MRTTFTSLAFAAAVLAAGQNLAPAPSVPPDVMVVAVSHDDSVLVGGIGTGRLLPGNTVDVSPLAWISPSGEWKSIACDEDHPAECRRFEDDYLRKPHVYTVVGADGWGARVRVEKMSLDHECFGYGGRGTFAGAPVRYATVAASSESIFTPGEPARRLAGEEAEIVRRAFAEAAGKKLDSTKELRVYAIQLEGKRFLAIERSFQNYGNKPEYSSNNSAPLNQVFAIGSMIGTQFKILSWQNQVDYDEDEQILGLIGLRSGRDFLVNTVSDPETQSFRIYGIQDGKLALVYKGGGGGC